MGMESAPAMATCNLYMYRNPQLGYKVVTVLDAAPPYYLCSAFGVQGRITNSRAPMGQLSNIGVC